MDLIVLEGGPNVGKTTTLNIVYQFLLNAGYIQVPGFFQDLKNNDFLDVLENANRQRIGIVTQGDYPTNGKNRISVKTHLQILSQANCHKTICACTTGPTKSKIRQAIQQYPLVVPPILKTKTLNASDYRAVDNKTANTIVSHI